jgi:hypothetical protein
MNTLIRLLLTSILVVAAFTATAEDTTYKPFVLASASAGSLDETADQVAGTLESAGFRIVGRYSPVVDTQILVATSDALIEAASNSERGAYAAAQRVSVSRVGDQVEVGFVNPKYIQYAYRLNADLDDVFTRLSGALGFERFCGGGDKKMTARKLGKYNYMMGMQKFDDPSELGSFDSHEAAVQAVEEGLAREGDGLVKVYRIDLPGGKQTLFGVGMSAVEGVDLKIDETEQMNVVDFEGCRKRAYFPYEVLVDGNNVEALHMRFRMAVHFPNLSMMGKHGFTKLMPYPGDIEEVLEEMLAGQ